MAGYIDFAQLKDSVSIDQVLSLLDLRLVQRGDQQRGQCPVCKGGERSLVVTKSKSSFYCFTAKKGGDMIDLVAHVLKLSQKDAAHHIASRFDNSSTVPEKKKEGLNPLAHLLPDHEQVKALGIADAKARGIGYAPKGVLRGRVAFPVRDRNGLLVYAGLGENPRWLFPSNFDPASAIYYADELEEGELRILSDPLEVVRASDSGIQAVCFLTDTVSAIQVEMLAALLDQTKCELVF